jgi:hypothetical protein
LAEGRQHWDALIKSTKLSWPSAGARRNTINAEFLDAFAWHPRWIVAIILRFLQLANAPWNSLL